MIDCTIIIRSFNEEKHIGKLMDGIRCQTKYNEIEVILVDSGSTDDTVKIAAEKGAKIVYIKSHEFSFGRAINIGCGVAKGKYLLFASAHVYPVFTDWVERMLLPFEQEKVALVYGKQIGNEITKYSEHRIFEKWFPKESNYIQNHPFCNNANAAIRRDLWLQNPYDETLTGLEDLDWGLKIQKKGLVVAYEAHAPIVHVHEETLSKIKNRYMREAIALKKILPDEKMSFLKFLRLSAANILSDSVHATRDKVLLKNFSEIIRFRMLQFWGTYLGLKQGGEVNLQLRQRFYYPTGLKKSVGQERPNAQKIIYAVG